MVIIAGVSLAAFYLAPASQQFKITERYLISVSGPDTRVRLGVLLPKDGPYQKVDLLSVDWDGVVSKNTSRFADVLKLVGTAKRGSVTEAVIEYRVTLTQGKISWQAPVESFQVEPQHNIESDHPIITEAAAEVAGGAGRNEARKLYEFTAGLLAWPEENRRFIDASALKAFTSGIGSCGEFANLMVALCRASNIPSQTVIGLLFPDMGPFTTAPVRPLNHPGQSHAWVEYYSGGRWEMADPSCSACNEDWLPFGWSDGRHLSYGEVNQLATTFGQTRDWAEENGQMIGNMFGSLKFVATAESEAAMVTPRATMRKGWDGRWLNLMLCWTVTMLLLQRWNLRRVRAVRGAIDAAKERELSRQTLPPGFAGEAAIAA